MESLGIIGIGRFGQMLGKIFADDFIVKGVKIWAYASVEGNVELNEQLQNQRAENIQAGLKSIYRETSRTESSQKKIGKVLVIS